MQPRHIVLAVLLFLAGCTAQTTEPAPTALGTEALPTASPVPETQTSPTHTPPPTAERVPAFGEPALLGWGTIRDAAFAPDQGTLAVGYSNAVAVYTVDGLELIWSRPVEQPLIALDTNGRTIAAILMGGHALLIDTETGTAQTYPGLVGESAFFGDVAWSPSGEWAAVQAIGHLGGSPIHLLRPGQTEAVRVGPSIDRSLQPELRWSPDSAYIASADRTSDPIVLDVASGDVAFEIEAEKDNSMPPYIAGWLPDGTTIIHPHASGSAQLTDITTGQAVGYVDTSAKHIYPSPDGARLLVATNPPPYHVPDFTVIDVADRERITQVGEQRHANAAGCHILERPAAAFDGQTALYFDTDGVLLRWTVGAQEGEVIGRVPVNAF
ncbi:MAG: WD40 repeat domain-containing protein, partial [Anaerolineae bacterium]